MKKILKGERGYVLALALIALGLGSVLVTPYPHSVSINLFAGRQYSEEVSVQNALDAGIADGIWNLIYGDFGYVLTDDDTYTRYPLGDLVNGVSPLPFLP